MYKLISDPLFSHKAEKRYWINILIIIIIIKYLSRK